MARTVSPSRPGASAVPVGNSGSMGHPATRSATPQQALGVLCFRSARSRRCPGRVSLMRSPVGRSASAGPGHVVLTAGLVCRDEQGVDASGQLISPTGQQHGRLRAISRGAVYDKGRQPHRGHSETHKSRAAGPPISKMARVKALIELR